MEGSRYSTEQCAKSLQHRARATLNSAPGLVRLACASRRVTVPAFDLDPVAKIDSDTMATSDSDAVPAMDSDVAAAMDSDAMAGMDSVAAIDSVPRTQWRLWTRRWRPERRWTRML